jgi:hypothetical protein
MSNQYVVKNLETNEVVVCESASKAIEVLLGKPDLNAARELYQEGCFSVGDSYAFFYGE